MDFQLGLYLAIGILIGFAIGWVITNVFSRKAKKYNSVKKELEQTKLELSTQKQMIVKHFSHSAEILDKMATDFRKLYKHMADNSSAFMTEQDEQLTLSNAKKIDEPLEIDNKTNAENETIDNSERSEEQKS